VGTANYRSPLCGASVTCSERTRCSDDAATSGGMISLVQVRGKFRQSGSVLSGAPADTFTGSRFLFCCWEDTNSELKWQYSVQQNALYFSICFIIQYHVEHCYMFRSFMGSLSGIDIKVILHKTELAIHIHITKIYKNSELLLVKRLVTGKWPGKERKIRVLKWNKNYSYTIFCNHRASFHSHYSHTPTGCNFI
jgi:hypothetical protein